MSLLSKVFKKVKSVVRSVAPIASMIPHPAAQAIGMLGSIPSSAQVRQQSLVAQPGTGSFDFGAPATASFLPALPPIVGGAVRALPAILGGTAARVGVSVAAATRSAVAWCRRNPSWCANAGGVAGVAALVQSGQLPVIKRRRGRGITATELRHFKRVARFTSKYCAPVRKAMKAPAMRRKGGC